MEALLAKLKEEDFQLDEKKLLDGETIRVTEQKRRKDGSTYWTQVQITAIDYEGKKVALSVNRDITEIKKSEEELKNSEERLKILSMLI